MIATRLPFARVTFDNVEPRWAWLWVLLGVVGAVVLFLTYWGIFQRSERRLAWWLMLLRAGGLLALFLALARPSWTSETEVVDAGRVAVVLDNSISMSLPDASGKPRYALAKDAVSGLKKRLEENHLQVDLFDINGAPLEAKAIPEQPTVDQTDLARAIRETSARLRSRPLAGLVLISDGMDTTSRRRREFREKDFPELVNQSTAIYTVGFRASPDAAGFDLAVRKPRAPERAMVNNEVKVDVPVSKKGGPAMQATVAIKRGRDQVVTEKVSFAEGDDEKVVSLKLTPREAGTFVYTAAVEGEAGERVLANNAAHFPLRVDKEKIQVLYVEGFLRYEYKFLKKHLEDDPDVNLTSEVRVLNPEQGQANNRKITPELLKNKHVVILGDMEGSYLSTPEYQAIVRWLEEKGEEKAAHALLVLGGYRSFGPEGFQATPLAGVLPVVFAKQPPFQSEEPFRLELTPEGQLSPIFEVGSDRVQDAADWSKAPPLLGCSLVARAKAVAQVLAVNPGVVRDGKKAVVVATQRYGEGRTMVMTADTTWRWSRFSRIQGEADTLYARFWSQTVRWLSGRSLDDKRPLMVVSTDQPDYQVGKPVTIRVQRQPRPDRPLTATQVAAEVTGPDGKGVAVEMRSNSSDPDFFTGSFYPSAGGLFEVAANLKDGNNTIANQAGEFLVHGSDLELADPGTNEQALESIARETGGQYFAVADAQQIADKIPRKERRLRTVQRAEFWINPGLSLFFLLAVSAEWFIRRRNHLV